MRLIFAGAAAVLFSAALALPCGAEGELTPPYVIADVVVLHSDILNEDRRLFIYNPDSVGGNVLPAYPVLYLLEENDMPMVSGMVKYLSSYNEQMPAMLVVGIDGGSDRIRDLTPTHALYDNEGRLVDGADSWLRTSGGGENFLRFVREEVMPFVERRYRTAPFRVLAGHSVGGLTSIYALSAHPDMFNAFLAVSPSLWWDRGAIVEMARDRMDLASDEPKFLFVADSPETEAFNRYVNELVSVIETKNAPHLQFSHAFYPNETHGSIAAKAYYDGLHFLFPDWEGPAVPESAAQLRAHYRAIGNRLGYSAQPGQGMVSDWAGAFLRGGKSSDAIDVYRWNVEGFPNSPDVFVELGDAYAQIGNRRGAADAYRRALSLRPGDADINAKLETLRRR